MAVNLSVPEQLPVVAGIRLAAVEAGIRYQDRTDLVLIEMAEGSTCAATFTRNAFCAAPVTVARQHLQAGATRYLLINSGNANAGTGGQGMKNAQASCDSLAKLAGVDATAVLPFSTGVIGEQLAVDKLIAALPDALAGLTEDGWMDAARGIMTTDTLPKGSSRTLNFEDGVVTISGISKGSGMIRPDMATMLSYVATDAQIDEAILQQLLNDAVDQSFNAITVDGDTSTNDACVLMATGGSGIHIDKGPGLQLFREALNQVMVELAQAIVRDGEGASKFITLRVDSAADVNEAREVAFTVAHSPLVKTAMFASDANWGRILAAIGRAPVAELDVGKVDIAVGGVSIIEGGEPAQTYTEELGASVFAHDEIDVHISLNRGDEQATVWTCDLSHDYVSINADYRS